MSDERSMDEILTSIRRIMAEASSAPASASAAASSMDWDAEEIDLDALAEALLREAGETETAASATSADASSTSATPTEPPAAPATASPWGELESLLSFAQETLASSSARAGEPRRAERPPETPPPRAESVAAVSVEIEREPEPEALAERPETESAAKPSRAPLASMLEGFGAKLETVRFDDAVEPQAAAGEGAPADEEPELDLDFALETVAESERDEPDLSDFDEADHLEMQPDGGEFDEELLAETELADAAAEPSVDEAESSEAVVAAAPADDIAPVDDVAADEAAADVAPAADKAASEASERLSDAPSSDVEIVATDETETRVDEAVAAMTPALEPETSETSSDLTATEPMLVVDEPAAQMSDEPPSGTEVEVASGDADETQVEEAAAEATPTSEPEASETAPDVSVADPIQAVDETAVPDPAPDMAPDDPKAVEPDSAVAADESAAEPEPRAVEWREDDPRNRPDQKALKTMEAIRRRVEKAAKRTRDTVESEADAKTTRPPDPAVRSKVGDYVPVNQRSAAESGALAAARRALSEDAPKDALAAIGEAEPATERTPAAAAALLTPQAREATKKALQAAAGASDAAAEPLDDVARDELKPMLASWLNTNMPQIVEQLVREELERMRDQDGDNKSKG